MIKRIQRNIHFFFLVLLIVPQATIADDSIEIAGDIIQIALPLTAYGLTYTLDDSEGRKQYTYVFLSTMAATYAIKLSVARERPNGGGMSFPSGHTSAAFSGASFIQMRYGWAPGSLAYAGAAYVGWSRVVTDNHYIEDVIAGAGLGILGSAIFTQPYLDKIHFMPFVSREHMGVMMTMYW